MRLRSVSTAITAASISALTALIALIALIALPAAVQAQTIAPVDRGWYNEIGFHFVENQNIVTGLVAEREFRSFFVFDIPTLAAGQVYTGAVLQLQLTNIGTFTQAGNVFSVDPTETYILNDVTTPLTSLTSQVEGGAVGLETFNDLGSGTTYGSRIFSEGDNNTLVSITLNAAALTALTAASGSQFGIGGYVSTISGTGNQFVLSDSDRDTNNGSNLILTSGPSASTAAPEPGSLALLLPVVGVAGMVIRKRKPSK